VANVASDRDVQSERQADLDALFSTAYDDLCRLAVMVRRDYRQVMVSPVALVNEAWLKLSISPGLTYESPLHFRRLVGRAMREVLIERIRRRNATKRGGHLHFVSLSDFVAHPVSDDQALTLRRALADLSRHCPRQAAIVRYRFFGGFEISEIASILHVSEATVLRDWRAAKGWLAAEMQRTA
jgi:RNA polymerase sigma factor (TIGR02999 family)